MIKSVGRGSVFRILSALRRLSLVNLLFALKFELKNDVALSISTNYIEVTVGHVVRFDDDVRAEFIY